MAAVTQSQFTSFLPAIKITVDATSYTIPVWNLSLTLVPWSGLGQPQQEMPDGTFRQKVRGWHIEVEFDAKFSHAQSSGQDDGCTATSAIEAAYDFGSLIIDFDPIDHVGKRLLTLVMASADNFSTVKFDGHIHNKSFGVSMITKDKIATGAIPSWFAGDTV